MSDVDALLEDVTANLRERAATATGMSELDLDALLVRRGHPTPGQAQQIAALRTLATACQPELDEGKAYRWLVQVLRGNRKGLDLARLAALGRGLGCDPADLLATREERGAERGADEDMSPRLVVLGPPAHPEARDDGDRAKVDLAACRELEDGSVVFRWRGKLRRAWLDRVEVSGGRCVVSVHPRSMEDAEPGGQS